MPYLCGSFKLRHDYALPKLKEKKASLDSCGCGLYVRLLVIPPWSLEHSGHFFFYFLLKSFIVIYINRWLWWWFYFFPFFKVLLSYSGFTML